MFVYRIDYKTYIENFITFRGIFFIKMTTIIFVLFYSHSPLCQTEDLVKTYALDYRVSLEVPKSFGPMKQDILELKYPNNRRPTEVISNNEGTISISLVLTDVVVTLKQLKIAHDEMTKLMKTSYPKSEWFRNEYIRQSGAQFFVLELITPAIDTDIHNIMYGTSIGDRLVIISFNVTKSLADSWLETGREIMSSISLVPDSDIILVYNPDTKNFERRLQTRKEKETLPEYEYDPETGKLENYKNNVN